jgi:uncharacterized protein YhbP (UPF0306 family)
VPITRTAKHPPAARLAALARRLLDASRLCAIATVSPAGRAHINTAYFAYGTGFEIVWVSAPLARHSRNIQVRRRIAIAVFDSTQTWGGEDRGMQLFGTARELRDRSSDEAERLYARRFPDAADIRKKYRFYRFIPRHVKLFDEPKLGGATWVTARVSADGTLHWERTERYV